MILRRASRPVRAILACLCVVALAGLLAACGSNSSGGSSSSGSTSQTKARSSLRVAFITTTKPGDNSYTDDMVNSFKQEAASLGVEGRVIEALDPSVYESTLRTAANAGYDVIATDFLGMQETLASVAPDFPNVKFIHIFGAPDRRALPNVQRIGYKLQDGTYLSGMLAAAVSSTGKAGFSLGANVPTNTAWANAYRLGALKVNPKMDVKLLITNSGFVDPTKSHDGVASLLSAGFSPVIISDEQSGAVQAAKEKNADVITTESSFIRQAPSNIPGVCYIHYGQSLSTAVKDAVTGAFRGGYIEEGSETGIVGLQISDQFMSSAPADVVKRVNAVKPQIDEMAAKIKSGEFRIPFNTTWQGS